MPRFRVSGDIKFAFVHEIEAASEDEACDLVDKLTFNDLDNTVEDEVEVHDVEEVTDA